GAVFFATEAGMSNLPKSFISSFIAGFCLGRLYLKELEAALLLISFFKSPVTFTFTRLEARLVAAATISFAISSLIESELFCPAQSLGIFLRTDSKWFLTSLNKAAS